MFNLLKYIYLSNLEEQNYYPVCLSSVCENEIVQLMGEKTTLLLKIVYCPQVVNYGLTILVKHCHSLPTLCNDGKYFEVSS